MVLCYVDISVYYFSFYEVALIQVHREQRTKNELIEWIIQENCQRGSPKGMVLRNVMGFVIFQR